jgi:hypothetical protein
MKRSVWSNMVLGLWLMLSPFLLAFVNRRAFDALWEDLLLGFGIATFSLCRLVSRRKDEIVFADWLVMALGALTVVNPFLYSYARAPLAKWNNLLIGAIVLILAIYQDHKDETALRNPPLDQSARAH